ncbi:MAG: S9 family peptidase [Phycisphaerales bacterium]|nr:S9 family peptidase [Phycisphaerales bacterium]
MDPLALVAAAALNVETPLIPREILFGNPERSSVGISPDGSTLSFRAPVDGVMNAWVQPIGGEARPLTKFTDRPIGNLNWSWNGQQLLFTKDKGGDENNHVYAVDIDDAEVHDLTPIDGVAAMISGSSKDRPDQIVIGINDRDARYHDLYVVNTRTGDRTLLQENDGYAGYLLDTEWNVRGRVNMTEDGGHLTELKDPTTGEWFEFLKVGQEDSMNTQPGSFNKAGDKLFGASSIGRDKTALVWWSPVKGGGDNPTVVFESDKADVSGGMGNPDTHEPEAVAVNYLQPEWHVIDDSDDLSGDFAALERLGGKDFSVSDRTKDNRTWIVVFGAPDEVPTYWKWNRDTKTGEKLFTTWPDLEGQPLQPMQGVEITARDGLVLPSYLTLPPNWTQGTPVPTIVLVHGGPWARDSWGYHPWHQWLANRGYAVISPNFRGSTGFGKGHVNAGDREWYGKMQDDLNDTAEWMVKKGYADENNIAIMGGSYGGYATLAGMTRDPELWACGVDIVGPSHVGTLLKTIPPYWAPAIKMFESRVGSLDEPAWLDAISPLTHVDYISKPLLIGQGANDPRVKVSESNQIVEAMNERDLPVTYIVFPDEGHGFRNPQNNMAFNAATEAFLAEHLGGRLEPIGTSIADSSAQVRDKGGLDFGATETWVATGEDDDTPEILRMKVSIDDLTPEQAEQYEEFKAQMSQIPAEQLPLVLNMLIAQSGQAPEEDKPLVAMIVQLLNERVNAPEATADVPTTP